MTVKPFVDEPGSKKEQVRRMFDSISGNYDFLNHLLSFNTDRRWRKRIRRLIENEIRQKKEKKYPFDVLDIACGTGDLSIELLKIEQSRITGLDLSPGMLSVARTKAGAEKIQFIEADSENMPFDDHSFDFVTVAFGVRNFENLNKGLTEMYRVLKPGGCVFILEFSKPGPGLFAWFYSFYSGYILPRLASLFTSEPRAYNYLPESISAFPNGNLMLQELNKAGFKASKFLLLNKGIASIYSGCKN